MWKKIENPKIGYTESNFSSDEIRKLEELNSNYITRSILNQNGFTNDYMLKGLFRDERIDFDGQDRFHDLVKEALASRRVVIRNDYDVDGDTSGVILYKGLRRIADKLGSQTEIILDQAERLWGYGTSLAVAQMIVEKYSPDFVITCDNGIKCKPAVDYLVENGVRVLVTDHHLSEESMLPLKADIIINPHYNQILKFEDVCGAMVVFILIRRFFELEGWNSREDADFLEEMEELAAVATVADVMPLIYCNRFLVKRLVEKARKGCIKNLGLRVLIKTAGIKTETFNSDDVGFMICPMLNAPGRLGEAATATNLLKATTENEAEMYATKCIELNKQRKDICREANAKVVLDDSSVICSYIEDCPDGIIGIISGNITEKTGKPSFVFCKNEDGLIKGSGRSPLNYNLIEGADKVLAEHPELVKGYGGHAGAMGITLSGEWAIAEFQRLMCEDYDSKDVEPMDTYYLDFFKDNDSIEKTFETVDMLSPYGEGLKAPVFRTFGLPLFIKDVGVDGSRFCISSKTGLNVNFVWFSGKAQGGFNAIYFSPVKEFFNGKYYYKGQVREMGPYKKST